MSVELQSLSWLQGHAADRPSFEVLRRYTFGNPRPFRAFALPSGLLFLEVRNKPGPGGNGPSKAIVAGAVLGGAIGAVIGSVVANSMAGTPEAESGFDYLDEDQLIELARTRKRSFVSKYDEIRSVAIEAPRGISKLLADRNLVGWITLWDDVLGRIQLEVRDPSAMSVAIDALPRRLGQRVGVHVRLDQRTARFVAC